MNSMKWTYRYDALKNPSWIIQMLKLLGVTYAIIIAAFMFADARNIIGLIAANWIIFAFILGVYVLSYMIYLLFFGRIFIYIYECDGDVINTYESKVTRSKFREIEVALTAFVKATGEGAAEVGTLIGAMELGRTINLKDIHSITPVPKDDRIDISGLLIKASIYAEKKDYSRVVEMIRQESGID